MPETATIRDMDQPGDLGWVLLSHSELYAQEWGWRGAFEALVARIVADYAQGHDESREAGWIADQAGRRVGSVMCTAEDDTTARLRVLLVEPEARGQHLGTRLVDSCIAFARAAGYERMVLWTNDPLAAARAVYLAAGFTLTAEEPHDHWGAGLLGQTYELELTGPR